MDFLIIFIKLFGLLVLLFLGVLVFFVYPTNILYKNDKFEPIGDPDRMMIGSYIYLFIITILLYFYYNVNDQFMCSISPYISCINDYSSIGVYVLMFIHLLSIIVFNLIFVNKLKEVIKTNKLDLYLFIFSSISIFLTVLNYIIYGTLFDNIRIIYFIVRILLYLVAFSPIYTYLIISLILKPRKHKKKKKKKIVKKEEDLKTEKDIKTKEATK